MLGQGVGIAGEQQDDLGAGSRDEVVLCE